MFWVSVEKPEIDAPSNQSVFLIRKKALSSSGHTVFNSPWRPTVPPADSVGSPHGHPLPSCRVALGGLSADLMFLDGLMARQNTKPSNDRFWRILLQ
jgi:hypothetical protein